MSEQFTECNMTCRNSLKVNSFKIIQFSNHSLKKINCTFNKSLLFQTGLEPEVKSLLLTVQLYFSWTLEMSN